MICNDFILLKIHVPEITHRFQTARREVRQLLLQYLLPWLHNMELVDPNVPPPSNPLSYYQVNVTHFHSYLPHGNDIENDVFLRNPRVLLFISNQFLCKCIIEVRQ